MAQQAPQVVRLDDYRRNSWSAIDLTWEHVAFKAVAALAQGERLRAALLLPQAESFTRLHTPADDPRRAATLTLLARWQLGLCNWPAAERLLIEADRCWLASAAWLDRLRPGETAEQQAECRRLLQRATTFTASLLERHETGLASPGSSPLLITSLPPDRRKLEAAVTTATANLEPLRVMSQAYS
jgi:hypothetical protein